MQCKKCGNILDKDTSFCTKCGEKVIQTQKKSNSKIIIIITIAILLTIISFVLGYIMGKNQNKENDNSTTLTIDKETKEEDDNDDYVTKEYTFNLFDLSKISKEPSDNSELNKGLTINELFFNPTKTYSTAPVYIYGKNNNTKTVNVKIILEFFDKEGYRIEAKTAFDSMVSAGKEFVINIDVPDDSLNYENVKMIYEAKLQKTYETEIPLDKIEYSNEKLKDGDISVTIKNNSTTEINIVELACLYYKDGKVIFAQNAAITGLKPNESDEIKFYSYKLNLNEDYANLKKIEYDDYKVFPYSAVYSDSENY